jgi:hypothetical protein
MEAYEARGYDVDYFQLATQRCSHFSNLPLQFPNKGRLIALSDGALKAVKELRDKYGHLPGPFAWHKYTTTQALWERLKGHLGDAGFNSKTQGCGYNL